jgi:hypothetical protein
MITLKGPDGTDIVWEPTLARVAELEERYGSLYTLGEKVLTQSLTLSDLAGAVKCLYRQAGCDADDTFILRRPCASILVAALLDVLGPVERDEKPELDTLKELMKDTP